MVREFRLDEVLRLKKPHPCGAYEWKVVRLGADIGLVCLGCGRRVLMARSLLERKIKGLAPSPTQQASQDSIDTGHLPG